MSETYAQQAELHARQIPRYQYAQALLAHWAQAVAQIRGMRGHAAQHAGKKWPACAFFASGDSWDAAWPDLYGTVGAAWTDVSARVVVGRTWKGGGKGRGQGAGAGGRRDHWGDVELRGQRKC